jgi:hypothetical protein
VFCQLRPIHRASIRGRRAADRARGRDPEAEPIRAQLRAVTPVFDRGLRLDRGVLG